MEPITLRLPADLLEELSTEANERGYSSRSEYIRHVLRGRSDIGSTTQPITDGAEPTTDVAGPTTDDYEELADRLDELEQRVSQLETPEPVDSRDIDPIPETIETDTDSREDDVVQWVRENQPVSKKDVIDEWHTECIVMTELSWWNKRVKPALKEAGASHTRNIGWSFE